jgi:hypothetical protein
MEKTMSPQYEVRVYIFVDADMSKRIERVQRSVMRQVRFDTLSLGYEFSQDACRNWRDTDRISVFFVDEEGGTLTCINTSIPAPSESAGKLALAGLIPLANRLLDGLKPTASEESFGWNRVEVEVVELALPYIA